MEELTNITIGDPFDYAVIDSLSMAEKIQILEFIAFCGKSVPEKGFTATQFEILTHLTLQRLVNPGFMPAQLLPNNWKR